MGRTDLTFSNGVKKWKLGSMVRTSGWSAPRRVLVAVLIIALLIWMFHPDRHACSSHRYTPEEGIPNDVVTVPRREGALPPCSLKFDGELPAVPQRPWTITKDDLGLLSSRFDILPGGCGRPTAACQPQVKVAVIVPYRGRPEQLQAFLWYMHHFLSMQYLDYTIIIVEQSSQLPFNRAKLFNVGFVEALAQDNQLDCFIFHDVDLLPENLQNIYGCSRMPRHLISSLNTFRYTGQACGTFGGAVAMRKEQFKKVNGMANRFFGWGAEDDEFRKRVEAENYDIIRWAPAAARYTMMIHEKAKPNPERWSLLESAEDYVESDGLNTLSYKRLQLKKLPLYTWILVDL